MLPLYKTYVSALSNDIKVVREKTEIENLYNTVLSYQASLPYMYIIM